MGWNHTGMIMATKKKQPRKRAGNARVTANVTPASPSQGGPAPDAGRPNLQEIPRANAPNTGKLPPLPPGLGAIETELRLGAYAPALVETFIGALGAAFATRAYRHLTEPRRLVVFVGHVGMHSGAPVLHVTDELERTEDGRVLARPSCSPEHVGPAVKTWPVTRLKETRDALMAGAHWCRRCEELAKVQVEEFAKRRAESFAAGGGIIGPIVKHEPPAEPKPADPAPLNCARCDAAPEIHPRKTHNFFTVSCPKCSWTLIARHKTNAVVGWNDHQMLLQRASPCSKCGMRPRINASSHGVALTCCGYATPARTTEHALAQWNEHAVDNPAAAEAPIGLERAQKLMDDLFATALDRSTWENPAAAEAPIGPERAQKLMDDLDATSAQPPNPNAMDRPDDNEFDVTEAVIEKVELKLGRTALCSRCGTAPRIYRRYGLYRVKCPTCRYSTLRFDSATTPIMGWNRSNPAPKPVVSAAAMEAADALSRELRLRGNDLVVRQAAAHPTVKPGQVYEELRTGIRMVVGAENSGSWNMTYLDDAGGYTIPSTDLLDQTKFRRLFKFAHLWQHEPDTTDRRSTPSCNGCLFEGTNLGEPACNLSDGALIPTTPGPAPDWCRLRQGPVLVTLEEKK